MKIDIIRNALENLEKMTYSIQTTAGYKFRLSNYNNIILNETDNIISLSEKTGGFSYIVDVNDIDLISVVTTHITNMDCGEFNQLNSLIGINCGEFNEVSTGNNINCGEF